MNVNSSRILAVLCLVVVIFGCAVGKAVWMG